MARRRRRAATRRRSAKGSRACTPPARTRFGGAGPLRIGSLELPNEPLDNWPEFYAERRLRPLLPARVSAQRQARASRRVCDRIGDLAGPPEPPARLHGDLWSGNVLGGAAGRT